MNKIKISLIVVSLLSLTNALAQQNKIGEIADIHLPLKAKKLSNEALRTMAGNNEKTSESPKVIFDPKGEYYQIDSFTLALYGEHVNIKTNYLEDSKKGFEGTFKKTSCFTCTAEIKEINNYKALIVFLDTRDLGYYYFYTIKNDNKASINGSISYDKSKAGSKAEALKTVYDLLKGMKFK